MDLFYLGTLRKQLALYLEDKLGAPSEQIILITTMASAIPFSLVNYLIHNRTTRLYYSLIVGFILHYSIYGINSLHTVFGTIGTYFFVKYFGRKVSPFYLLAATMAHLSILNIIRMIVDFGGWAIDDISTIYLVEVAKFSAFGFSYADGGKDIKDFVNNHHKEMRIEKMPSLLEFSSYIYFYPTTIIGPFIEFNDFINFIDKKGCYANLPNRLGFIFTEGLKKLCTAIFFILFFTIFGSKYPMEVVGTPELRKNYPKWWMRILYMYICGPVARSKYYIAWCLTYSSLIFSGMSYGETTIKDRTFPNVEKGSYGSIIYNEIGINPRYKMVYWNMSIHIWLKYNVYTRVIGSSGKLRNNKVIAAFITYAVSAIWHGFYPSYYISFFMIYLFEQDGIFLNNIGYYDYVDKYKLWNDPKLNTIKKIKELLLPTILMPLTILKTSFLNDIIGSIFFCLEIGSTKEILINYYGLPVNVILGFYILTIIYTILNKKLKNNKEKENGKEKIDKEMKKKVE